jgi:hypothetical protein
MTIHAARDFVRELDGQPADVFGSHRPIYRRATAPNTYRDCSDRWGKYF